MSRPSLIVVEDEADLRASLCTYLETVGFDVRGVGDGALLDHVWGERPADILVLDVNLPGETGFAIAQRLRSRSSVGIIMMTARSAADDRTTGYEVGADIYLVKPVLPQELAAAVRRLLSRLATVPPEPPPLPWWTLDRSRWALVAPNGKPVTLTSTELRLIERLLEAPGRTVPVGALAIALYEDESHRNRLDVLLSRLRRKVLAVSGLPIPIKALRGEGYVFPTRSDGGNGS